MNAALASELANPDHPMSEQPSEGTAAVFLEGLMHLNNQLIDMQRELTQKNIELAEQQNQLQRIVSESPVGFVILDNGGIVHFANQATEKLLGQSAAEIVGQKFRFDVENRRGVCLSKKDGTTLSLDIKTIDTLWNKQKMHLISLHDEGEAIAASHLRDLFVAVAAHDLRAPLSVILGFATLLETDLSPSLSSTHLEYLELMKKSATEMAETINNLLDISAIRQGKATLHKSTFCPAEALDNRVAILKKVATAKGSKIYHTIEIFCAVTMDKTKVCEIFDNLISNALKFSPPGSNINVLLTQQKNQMVFSVSDQGPGISISDREKLFQPFQKLHATPTSGEKSTGLGLSIVHSFVALHGGTIEVQALAKGGTMFTVAIPIDGDETGGKTAD